MRNKKPSKKIVADFETTSYEGQTHTEVWASAWVNLGGDLEKRNVHINNSLSGFMAEIFSIEEDCTIYFHNLKFDGTFIMWWLMKHPIFKEAQTTIGGETGLVRPKHFKEDAPDWSYTYTISDRNVWYSIMVKHNGILYEFIDSLKILPFSVKQIGKAFKTKHQKTIIEYTGYREEGGKITEEERDYIANDVLVVAEALTIMFDQGHDKSTIGANCLSEFKQGGDFATDRHLFRKLFPNLYEVYCPIDGYSNADEYIRKAYRGGWCYLKKGLENKEIIGDITICDVNSLYPSVMSGESGNRYPVGKPQWFSGGIPDKCNERFKDGGRKYYYYVRVRSRFYLKDGYLPTIMLKGNPLYPPREWLESSDYQYKGKTYRSYLDDDGNEIEAIPAFTLTCTDWELMQKHYNLEDTEILDGCYFRTTKGIFDPYIDKWRMIKETSSGALRTLAKLFLNNLYGKFASSDESSYKRLFQMDDKIMSVDVEEHEKQSGYIAIGAAITAYARLFTITAAQLNYLWFMYADTDSIHCKCKPDDIIGAPEHPTKFLHWKYEGQADKAIYVRAKRYIEHITGENREEVEPYYLIKCAGMGATCKGIVENKLKTGAMNLSDFKSGLVVSGNLKAHQIDGGIVLVEQDFKLH